MKTLISVKKDLQFNTGLSSLIETLKSIAVSQYRSLEGGTKTFEEFSSSVTGFFELIDISGVNHPFLRPKSKNQLVVAVTTDSGFLGGLNMQVVGTAIKELEKMPGQLVIIGEKGKRYIRGTGFSCVNFPGIKDDDKQGQAMQLRDYIIDRVFKDSVGYVSVVYPRPVSFTVQHIEMLSFLPFSSSGVKQVLKPAMSDIIMESSTKEIAEYLVHLWMGQKLYEIFGLSRLAEFAARYMHLEESSQKLKDVDKKVRLEYFRVQHELVDRTMRELFAGRALYAKRK